MALSDRDIIITPNRGASSEPIITLRGADAASSATMVMRVINSGTVSTLSYEGTSGQLFAVSDTFTGSIFSVNDVSGIPSIEVLDSGLVKLAEYNGKVQIGSATNNENATSATTGELQVVGGVGISRDVYVGGAMTVVGTLNAAVIAGSITNAANVGITNDTSSAAAQYLTFVSGTSGNLPLKVDGSELVFVPSTGRIGIGNTAPAYKLHVTGEAQVQNYLRITNTGGAQSLLMGNQDSAGVNNPSIIVAANGTIFFGNGNSWTGSGGTYTYRANISSSGLFLGTGTTSATYPLTIVNASPVMSIGNSANQGGAIYFGNSAHGVQRIGTGNDVSLYTTSGNVYLSANGVATTSHVALLNNGNVGIGTGAPSTKLHILKAAPSGVAGVPTDTDLLIDSNTNSYLTFRQSADGGLYGGLQWVDNNVGAYIVFRNATGLGTAVGSDSLIYGTYQDHIFQAGTSESVNGKIEVARITQAGNMGIGKTAPTTRLHVFRDGLANNTVNPLITLDGKFNVVTVDSNDIVAIASRVENNAGGSQTTNIIGSGFQTTYNSLLLQPSGGNVGINNTNPGRALDVTGVANVTSHITQGPLISRPNVAWGASGTSTGAVVIKFPGGSANYGMVHIVIDIYTYDGENASTIIIGGHNWNSAWYSYGATRIGAFSKGVRVAFKDGQYAVVLGTNTSTWSYGQVVVRKIQNGSYYSGVMDLGGTYTITQDAAAESYTWISSNLITTGSAGGGGWNSGNDGSGSGLDADLIDGLDSTAFLRRDVTNTMFAGQTSSLAFENQGTFFRFAFNELRFWDNQQGDIFGLDEHAYATTSMRAPIFYDRDDTAYYVNPNSESRLWYTSVNVGQETTGGANSSNAGLVLRGNYNSNTWAHKFHKFDNGSGVPLYLSKTVGTGVWTAVQGWGSGLSYDSQVFGSFAATTSAYAPIYYDYNDSGYYVDPASTSLINTLQLNGNITRLGGYSPTNGAIRMTPNLHLNALAGYANIINWDNGTTGATQTFRVGNGAGADVYYIRADGYSYQTNYAENASSFRAPIFYDSNNTGYYVDPASSSVVNNLTVNGTLTYSGSLSAEGAEVLTTDLNTSAGNQGWDLHGNRAIQAIYGNHNVLNNGNVYNAALFRGGSWTLYGFNGSSWVNLGAVAGLTNGYGKANWGTITLSRSYSQFIIDCGNTFGYTFMSALTLTHSTSGNSMNVYFEKSTSATYNSGTWTTMAEATGVGSWPGGTSIKFSDVVGASYPPYVRLRIIPTWTHPSNTISLGQLFVSAAYGGGNQLLEWDTSYNVTANGSFRAPIFYDSNDTTYYVDPNGGSRLSRFLTINAGQTGIYGNELVVGNTAVTYSLEDGNQRPIIQAHGAYPVLSLNHTVTSNTNHGPTIQFTANGVGNQFVIGMNGNGTQLDMGYASNSNWNPHNGIAGYEGVTFFRATSSGLIGIGAQGDWGALGGGSPGYAIDTRGTLYNNTDVRAPIFYDANDTTYYVDPNSTSYQRSLFLGAHDSGTSEFRFGEDSSGWYGDRWYWDSAYTAYRYSRYAGTDSLIHYHDTRDTTRITYGRNIVFDNYGKGIVGTYDSTRLQAVFSMGDAYKLPADGSTAGSLYGLAWSHPNAGTKGGANNLNDHGLLLINNGTFRAAISSRAVFSADVRGTLFYDYDNTGYYLDPNGTSNVSGNFRINHSGNSGLQLLSTTGTQSLWIRTGWDQAPTPVVSFNNVQFQSSGSSGGSFTFYSGNTLALTVTSDYAQGAGSLRAPIFYDSNDTGYYVDPNSNSRFAGSITISQNNATGGGIIFADDGDIVDLNDAYCSMRFSYGVRIFSANKGGSAVHTLHSDGNAYHNTSCRAPIFYDNNDTGFYTDPASTSRMRNIDVASGAYTANYYDAAIEIREYNFEGAGDDTWQRAPRLGFHWGGRVASSIAMSSNGWINIMNNPGTGWENLRANQGLFNSEVTAYYSDVRLKTRVGTLDKAIEKVKAIETFKYVNNELANSLGFTDDLVHVGVSAQSVEAVLPEVVRHAPFDIKVQDGKEVSESGEWYKTVQYDKLVPLLIEAIKEQQIIIEQHRAELDELRELKELVKKSLGK